ncbi:MAG: AAA family ATPase [Rhodoferax sp.]|nr:AAA family ATPase [Rhodoferax sp.]
MLNRNKLPYDDTTELPEFTRIVDSGRSLGLYVPTRQKDELTRMMLKRRLLEESARQTQEKKEQEELDQIERTLGAAPQAKDKKLAEPTDAANAQTNMEGDANVNAEDGILRVDCVNQEDLIAQKAAADKNFMFAERARITSIKEMTKALLARPMTRKIGMPMDVDAAMQKLTDCAPHIPRLVQSLRIPLQVAKAKGVAPMIAPILLVGPAGVGKSHVAQQIADILGVPAHNVSYAASSSVGNVLSGADKNWGNSSTGIVFNALTGGDYANPVICLDELDKASNTFSTSGPGRNPLNELLALLEPVTAKAHKDRCAEIRVDARHIVWVATANSLKGLSGPLLSRFELIMVNKPDARAAVMIALSVAKSVNTQMGADVKLPSGEVLQWLATVTPRLMRRIWTTAASWTAAQGRNRVTMNDISVALGATEPSSARLH